jgi:hypothetical protein
MNKREQITTNKRKNRDGRANNDNKRKNRDGRGDKQWKE